MNDSTMEDDGPDPVSTGNSDGGNGEPLGVVMTLEAQKERRNSIRDILSDEALTPLEKRRSIQCLMDGRRRSSQTRSSSGSEGEMARAAAEATDCYQSDTEGDASVAMDSTSGDHSQHHPQQPNAEWSYGYGATQQSHASSSPQSSISGNIEHLVQSADLPNSHYNNGRKQRSSSMPLWSEDTSRAAAPLVAASSNAIWDEPLNVSRRMEKSRPPCSHYERNCTIISPCCGLAFGCRICHDECPVLPMPFARRPMVPAAASGGGGSDRGNDVAGGASGEAGLQERVLNWDAVEGLKHKQEKRRSLPLYYEEQETHHEIDRFAIAEVICRLCHTRQSSKT